MAASSEGKYAGEFLAGPCDEESRDAVTVLSGQTLKAGTVVGKAKLGIGRALGSSVTGTGNGTLTGVVARQDVQLGTYTLKCTTKAANAGTFSVTCPDGTKLADATVGTAYVSTHLDFLINDGGTDFEVNDQFTIVVSTSAPAIANGGSANGTIGSLTLGRLAMPGRYRFLCTATGTNAGTFELYAPDGALLERQTVSGGAGGTCTFSINPQIGAVITDGSADFEVGGYFDVVVHNLLVPKVAAWTPRPTTFDGRQVAAGVLFDAVDASGGDAKGVIVARDAVVNAAELEWLTGLGAADQAAGRAQLLALGIVSR